MLLHVHVILGLLGTFVATVVFLFYRIWSTATATENTDQNLFQGHAAFDAVMAHTYCPRGAVTALPLRGKLLAQAAYLAAKRFNCPLILAVGNTVPGEPRTESEIYRDFIFRFYEQIPVLLGQDSGARDTWRETVEAHRIASTGNFRKILVLGMRPHLARIIPYWHKVNRGDLQIQFLGIYGPAKYFLWETAMIVAETIIPAGSKRREIILNLAGRKG